MKTRIALVALLSAAITVSQAVQLTEGGASVTGANVMAIANVNPNHNSLTKIATSAGSEAFTLGSFSGTVHSTVWKNPDNTLDFIFQVFNTTPANGDAFITLSFSGFHGFTVDAYRLTAGDLNGTDPSFVAGGTTADNVSFSSSGSIVYSYATTPILNMSMVLDIHVENPTNFTGGTLTVADNHTNQGQHGSFAPTPEPVTMGLGVAGIGLFLRRRRKV